jgi:hypothetical protein
MLLEDFGSVLMSLVSDDLKDILLIVDATPHKRHRRAPPTTRSTTGWRALHIYILHAYNIANLPNLCRTVWAMGLWAWGEEPLISIA